MMMPSSCPGAIDAFIFELIPPPEQPVPNVYLIGPQLSVMCSFIIITVSAIMTRFELREESVMLLTTWIIPRER
jgi:hypothetical protein